MPVIKHTQQEEPAHINPPLIIGEVYRIISMVASCNFVKPGQYFSAGPDETVVYLGGRARGWDRRSRFAHLGVKFVSVTLGEVYV